MLAEGVKNDGALKAIQVTDDGKLKVDASVSVDAITIGDIEIKNDVGNPVPVSGPLTDAELRATAVPVSGPLTDTQLRANAVPVSGPLTDTQLRAAAVPTASGGAKATASISRVSASATSVTLLAANANRRRVIIHNESTASLRIKLGATASATSYSLLLGPGDTYESPTDWVYTGAVDGIWDAANGAAQITEV